MTPPTHRRGAATAITLGILLLLTACGAPGPTAALSPIGATDATDATDSASGGAVVTDPGSAPPGRSSAGSAAGSAAAGARVAGIPSFVAVPPGATVTGSAVGHKGRLLEVSITASTRARVVDVLAFYRRTLTTAGFSATDDAVLPPGSAGTAYGRSGTGELLVVAVVDHGTSRSFSIGGTVAGSSR